VIPERSSHHRSTSIEDSRRFHHGQLPATDATTAGALPVFVGWPAKWDDTGVKTFVVDRDGVVRQKDLGPESAARVRAMSAYAPDASWQKVD